MNFLCNNALSHRVKCAKKKVKALNWKTLTRAAYAPDLAPYDYQLFILMGYALAKQHLVPYENVEKWHDDWFTSKTK